VPVRSESRRVDGGADAPAAVRTTTWATSRGGNVALPLWVFVACAAALVAAVGVVAWHPRLWPLAACAAVSVVAVVSAVSRRHTLRASRSLGDDLMASLHQANAVVTLGDLDGGWVAEVDGDIEAIMGYTVDEWRTLDYYQLIHPADAATYWIDADTIAPGMVVDRTGRLRHADGRWVWIREVARVSVDERGRRTIRGFFFDVSAIKDQAQRLAEQARTDSLTLLPNRLALVERISAAIDGGDRFALLMLDLDRFKEVNDTLGHEAGDHVLRVIAERLGYVLGSGDTLFRLGGDEFAVLVRGGDTIAELESQLLVIAAEAARPIEAWGIQLVLTVSIGVAFPRPGSDRAMLMRHADLAMYAAKRAGEPWRVYDGSLDRSSTVRLSLTAALETALVSGQFELFFQPQIDLDMNAVVGAEGLARWRHPEFGLLTPDAFLDVVLMSESTAAFTTEMVRQALDLVGRARRAGRVLPVSVNVPIRAFGDVGFVGSIMGQLEAAAVEPELLTIEITEDDVAEPSAEVLATLHQLATHGIRISVDDLGTGHSSLSRLQVIRVHELKIDRAFVERLADDERDRHLAAAIVNLADGLGYRVVAEGVETDAQADALRELGCGIAQGYRFSPAVPAADFARLLADAPPGAVAAPP